MSESNVSITTSVRADQLVKELRETCDRIVGEKRPVYTQKNPDVLHNFKMNALMANATIGQAIAFGLAKQFLSVIVLITDPSVDDAEKETRFPDLHNYTDLAYIAWKEGRAHGQQ